jgi:hypothetical protein
MGEQPAAPGACARGRARSDAEHDLLEGKGWVEMGKMGQGRSERDKALLSQKNCGERWATNVAHARCCRRQMRREDGRGKRGRFILTLGRRLRSVADQLPTKLWKHLVHVEQ